MIHEHLRNRVDQIFHGAISFFCRLRNKGMNVSKKTYFKNSRSCER
jgi:hypothetical protein